MAVWGERRWAVAVAVVMAVAVTEVIKAAATGRPRSGREERSHQSCHHQRRPAPSEAEPTSPAAVGEKDERHAAVT